MKNFILVLFFAYAYNLCFSQNNLEVSQNAIVEQKLAVGINPPLSLPNLHLKGDYFYHQGSDDIALSSFVNSSYIGSVIIGNPTDIFDEKEGFDIDVLGNSFEPYNDNTLSLGNASYKWTEVWATNGMIQTSDQNLKTNIDNSEYGIETVMKLRPITFNWKSQPDSDKKIGFVAQEMLKVLPEAVREGRRTSARNGVSKTKGSFSKSSGDTYGINYAEIIPVLTKAIQDQQHEIEALKEEIRKLKN